MSSDPSQTTEARCGSCLYWQQEPGEPEFGECLWAGPVPMWVQDADRHDAVMASDGRGCRTYARKVETNG